MMRLLLALGAVVFLAACGEGDSNSQSDPINDDPASSSGSAPTDQDPTPQTGTGGQSPVESPSGTEKR